MRPPRVIGKILATDADSGPNALLTYTIDPHASKQIKEYFTIESQNGTVMLMKQLDNEGIKDRWNLFTTLPSHPITNLKYFIFFIVSFSSQHINTL